MSQHLPTNHFSWLTREEIAQIDNNSLDDETNIGYIFEIDMNYLRSLYDHHNAYPLAPERLTIYVINVSN